MRPEPAQPRLLHPLALLFALAVGGTAQAQTFRIQPTLNAQLTWTDNVDVADADPQQDWILELSPGVSMVRESGRLKGALDLRLRSLNHVERTEENTTYLALNGRGSFEAIENSVFVDVDGSISRDNQSSFRGRLPGDALDYDEDNEVRVFSLAPRYVFRFGAGGEGRVSYRERWLDSGSSGGGSTGSGSLGDQQSRALGVGLSDPAALRLFGWGLDYSRSETRYDERATRDVEQEVARGTLFINLDPQFRLRAIGGYESNDYAIADGESGQIWGGGFDWYPTERTAISATGERRIFGNGYDLSLRHRMARSAFSLTARRDISSLADEIADGFMFDPAYQVLYQALTSLRPDLSELERSRLALEAYRNGSRDAVRSNAYYVQRSVGASWTIDGVRNTLTLSVQRSDRNSLDTLSGFRFGGELENYDRVSTRSASLSFSHRLSGFTTLNAGYVHSKSTGSGSANDETTRSIARLGVSRRLGANTDGGLTYRHTRADGSDAYTENAVTATLGMRF